MEFRILTALLVFGTFLIGSSYRRRAAQTGEAIPRTHEGPVTLVALRLGGLAGLILIVLFIVAPGVVSPLQWSLGSTIRWVGFVLGLAGAGLMIWTFHNLGRNVTDTVVVRSNAGLVQSGPYAWVRHPLYTSGLVFWAGLFLLSQIWLVAPIFIFVYGFLISRTRTEEAFLIERFGQDYLDYSSQVGRFFPRLWTKQNPPADPRSESGSAPS